MVSCYKFYDALVADGGSFFGKFGRGGDQADLIKTHVILRKGFRDTLDWRLAYLNFLQSLRALSDGL